MTDLLIIGGGPAGLAAAVEAAGYGMDVTIADENPEMGGQLRKQTHKFFGSVNHFAGTRGYEIAEELTSRAESLGVTMLTDTRALGVLDDGSVALLNIAPGSSGRQTSLRARTLLLSVGARENSLSFPGCTLPGVMGAGAAQTFSNLYGTLVGKRILMVGSGNVGLIVSYQLMQAGAEIAGIIEAAPKIGGYGVHAAKIRRAGVPILTNHTIVAAEGADHVRSAVIAAVDASLRPVPGTFRRIECDTVLLAVGLTPRTELASMLKVPMTVNRKLGGLVPVHDETMATGLPHVFTAGDSAGVEEASIALTEGRLAGLCAAETCGYDVPPGRKTALLHDLEGLRRETRTSCADPADPIGLSEPALKFSELPGVPVPDTEALAYIESDPVICRCEEIRRSQILEAIDAGCLSVAAVKRYTRAGMGSCQGRTCSRMIEALLREHGVNCPAPAKARYPVVPCYLENMEESE